MIDDRKISTLVADTIFELMDQHMVEKAKELRLLKVEGMAEMLDKVLGSEEMEVATHLLNSLGVRGKVECQLFYNYGAETAIKVLGKIGAV